MVLFQALAVCSIFLGGFPDSVAHSSRPRTSCGRSWECPQQGCVMIDFSCPHCQKALKVKPELAGKRIRCPHCQQASEVPLPAHRVAAVPLPTAAPGRVPTHAAGDTEPPPRASLPATETTLPPR